MRNSAAHGSHVLVLRAASKGLGLVSASCIHNVPLTGSFCDLRVYWKLCVLHGKQMCFRYLTVCSLALLLFSLSNKHYLPMNNYFARHNLILQVFTGLACVQLSIIGCNVGFGCRLSKSCEEFLKVRFNLGGPSCVLQWLTLLCVFG